MPCERSFLEQKAIGIAMSLVGAYWRSGKHWCSRITCVPQIETSRGNGSKLWASDGCVFWSSSEQVEVNFKGLEGWKCLSSVLRWLKTGRRSASLQYPLNSVHDLGLMWAVSLLRLGGLSCAWTVFQIPVDLFFGTQLPTSTCFKNLLCFEVGIWWSPIPLRAQTFPNVL